MKKNRRIAHGVLVRCSLMTGRLKEVTILRRISISALVETRERRAVDSWSQKQTWQNLNRPGIVGGAFA
jgi:hypothetical protein